MTKTELLVDRLQVARRWTKDLLADIDEGEWFNMPTAGVGHVAWQVGHLASSQVALIHVRCFGRDYEQCLPRRFREAFGRGSTPVAAAGQYPSIDEIRSAFDRIHAEAIQWVGGLPDADLGGPAGDEPHPFFNTKEGAIATAAMHETFHAGQIAILRRWAGKKPLR